MREHAEDPSRDSEHRGKRRSDALPLRLPFARLSDVRVLLRVSEQGRAEERSLDQMRGMQESGRRAARTSRDGRRHALRRVQETGEGTMKLGDIVFVYRPHGRHERSLEDHLSHWVECKIESETKVSFVAKADRWTEVKIDKKTLLPRGNERIAASREEISDRWEDDQWRTYRVYRMADRLRFVKDVEVLRKVAELIGYDPKDEK